MPSRRRVALGGMPPKTSSFKSPGLASTRSGTNPVLSDRNSEPRQSGFEPGPTETAWRRNGVPSGMRGAPRGIRTHDPRFRRPMLYPLSYRRMRHGNYSCRRKPWSKVRCLETARSTILLSSTLSPGLTVCHTCLDQGAAIHPSRILPSPASESKDGRIPRASEPAPCSPCWTIRGT